jgi:predicted XRE-type DNA-binding protein
LSTSETLLDAIRVPVDVRRDFGRQLFALQCGELPGDAKPIGTGMPGARELRTRGDSGQCSSKVAWAALAESLADCPVPHGGMLSTGEKPSVKAELYVASLKLVRVRDLSPKQVGELLSEPHSRVIELLGGKLSLVTVDTLVGYVEQPGADVTIKVTRRAS